MRLLSAAKSPYRYLTDLTPPTVKKHTIVLSVGDSSLTTHYHFGQRLFSLIRACVNLSAVWPNALPGGIWYKYFGVAADSDRGLNM